MFRIFLAKNLNSVSLLAGLIFIDQLTKHLIRLYGGFYLCNQGIAWGINFPGSAFWMLWIGIIALIVFAIATRDPDSNPYCLIIILSGAISNIIDRLVFGCVIDFIDVHVWPVFNMADIFIVFGGLWFLAKYLKKV